jgi:hypothetical protein
MSVALCDQRTTTPTIQLFVLHLTVSISSVFLVVVVVVVDFMTSLAIGDNYMSRGSGCSRAEYNHQKNEYSLRRAPGQHFLFLAAENTNASRTPLH